MLAKKQKTRKLFFNKYTNKIDITSRAAFLFRGKQIKKAEVTLVGALFEADITRQDKIDLSSSRYYQRLVSKWDLETALDLVKVIKQFDSNEYCFRIEGSTLGIYSNNDTLVKKILNINNLLITAISSPDSNNIKDALLSTPNLIIKEKVDRFRYKISINGLFDNAVEFLRWTDKMSNHIKTTGSTYQYGGYFYVTDERMISICSVYLGDKITKIEKFVTSSEL